MTIPRRRLAVLDALACLVLLCIAFVPAFVEAARQQPIEPGLEDRAALLSEFQSRRALGRGILPLWDPFQFGGRPHVADPEMRTFYPPHFVARLFPLEWFFVITVVLHAWAAGVGGYLVARQFRLTRLAAIAGGGAAMFVTVLADGSGYSPALFRLAWIPLAMAFALWTAARPQLLPHPGLVVTLVLAFMSASVRGSFYTVAAVVGCFLFAMLWRSHVAVTPRRQLVQLALLVALVVGLTAIQTMPFAQFWTSLPRAAAVAAQEPAHERAMTHARDEGRTQRLAAILAPVRRGRVVSGCGGAADAGLVMHGVPIAGGHGGVIPADYARFLNLASGRFPDGADVYRRHHDVGGAPARNDLLALLDAEFLVSCQAPDPGWWAHVADVSGVGVYRSVRPLGRAVWTCAPRRIGREELQYRLERQRYDPTLTLNDAGPAVHVRWAAGMRDPDRRAAEADFGIVRERFLGQRTWQYELTDRTSSNIAEIVTSPLVEDTAGLDRSRFGLAAIPHPAFDREPKTEWLIGGSRCEETRRASVLVKDREDGRLVLMVDAPRDGLVFVSETYSPERLAWVDGRRVEPLRVNGAFTGIPVAQGSHRIELKYDSRPFWFGASLSALSLLLWTVSASWAGAGSGAGVNQVGVGQN